MQPNHRQFPCVVFPSIRSSSPDPFGLQVEAEAGGLSVFVPFRARTSIPQDTRTHFAMGLLEGTKRTWCTFACAGALLAIGAVSWIFS